MQAVGPGERHLEGFCPRVQLGDGEQRVRVRQDHVAEGRGGEGPAMGIVVKRRPGKHAHGVFNFGHHLSGSVHDNERIPLGVGPRSDVGHKARGDVQLLSTNRMSTSSKNQHD